MSRHVANKRAQFHSSDTNVLLSCKFCEYCFFKTVYLSQRNILLCKCCCIAELAIVFNDLDHAIIINYAMHGIKKYTTTAL